LGHYLKFDTIEKVFALRGEACMTLEELNALGILEARAAFELCCGSQRWIDGMLMRKPFASAEDLQAAGREIWGILDPKDWREAFSHHPRVEGLELLRIQWPGTPSVSDETFLELKKLYDDYYEKFGYAFLASDSGTRRDDVLARLDARLNHSPDEELKIAASEHEKITAKRLEKLVGQSL